MGEGGVRNVVDPWDIVFTNEAIESGFGIEFLKWGGNG
jgi:hypothetical protein